MLPEILKGPQWAYRGAETAEWLDYLKRIGPYALSIDRDFLSEICYEHWSRFNDWFPRFDLERHRIQRQKISAAQVKRLIRYDYNEALTFWSSQFDQCREKKFPFPYIVFDHMVEHGTWPFPPVVIEAEFAKSLSDFSPDKFGNPWHLIEGTHRVSYLNRMLELALISPESEHEILWLCS